ncbi:hypothetical protein K8R66_03300 [bacterium]|nr:hypothetical protein [bacterium]
MKINKDKDKFLKNEFFSSSIQGAFMHNRHIYKTKNESERKNFKTFLYNKLSLYTKKYEKKIKEEEHIKNLKKIQKEIYKYYKGKKLLKKDDTLNIGTIQKLLNLYLKYLWVSGYIVEPPHCPIDSTVIKTLVKNGAKHLENIKWTEITIKKYKKIIEAIKKEAKNTSLAKWELLTLNKNRK